MDTSSITTIIVDDEPAARRTLREYCALEADVAVIGEYADSRTALDAIRTRPPDLLFLDIQMPALTGLEMARLLDPVSLPLIVFVTAYNRYALEAFEVSATDYLLKPFDQERFGRTMQRVRQRHAAETAGDRRTALDGLLARFEQSLQSRDDRPRLLAESLGRMHMVDVAQIELVEADRNYVRLRVGRDGFTARSTLLHAEQAMSSQPVLKISRSSLVNMNHVREVGRTPRGDFIFVLAGGATVTSSEGYRERVRQYLDRMKLGH